MSHDPLMHGMMTSTAVLLLVPFLFVVFAVLWFRQTAEARARHFRQEAAEHRGETVEQY